MFNIVELIYEAKDKTLAASKSVEKNLGRVASAAMKVKAAYVAIAAAALAIAGSKFLEWIHDSVSALDELAKTSDRIGVSVEAFQELDFAARQSGVTTEALALGIQRFGRRIGEASENMGELRVGLKLLEQRGLGVRIFDESGQKLREVDAIFTDFIDRLGQIEDVAVRNAIAMKGFDVEGVALVNMSRDGAGALQKMRDQARELGVVIDEYTVRKAEELNNQLDILAFGTSQHLKKALVEAAPLLVFLAEKLNAAAQAASAYISAWVGFSDLPAEVIAMNLEPASEELERMRGELAGAAEQLHRLFQIRSAGFGSFWGASNEDIEKQRDLIASLAEQVEDYGKRFEEAQRIAVSRDLETLLSSEVDLFGDLTSRAGSLGSALGAAGDQEDELAKAMHNLERQIAVLGTTSDVTREKLKATFEFRDTVASVLTATQTIGKATRTELVQAAEEGTEAFRKAVENNEFLSERNKEALLLALDAYAAKLHEIGRLNDETFTELERKVQEITTSLAQQEILLKIGVDDTGLSEFLAAQQQAEREFQQLQIELDALSKKGVDVSAAREQAAATHEAKMQAIAREGGQKLLEVRQELAFAGLDAEERAYQEQLAAIDKWFLDRYKLVQAGLESEEALYAAYGQKLKELQQSTNVFAQAFEVDIKQTAADAMRHLGDQTADTITGIVTGTVDAKQGFQELAASIGAMGVRMLAQIVVARTLSKVFGGLGFDQAAEGAIERGANVLGSAGEKNQLAAEAYMLAAQRLVEAAQAGQEIGSTQVPAQQTLGGGIDLSGIVTRQEGAAKDQVEAADLGAQSADAMTGAMKMALDASGVMDGAAGGFLQAGLQLVQGLAGLFGGAGGGMGGLGGIFSTILGLFASAQTGGITTQEGLINVHPQEAIIPLDQLGGIGGVTINQTIVFEEGGGIRSSSDSRSDRARDERIGNWFENRTREIILEERRPGGLLDPARERMI